MTEQLTNKLLKIDFKEGLYASFQNRRVTLFCKNTSLMSQEIERFNKEHNEFIFSSRISQNNLTSTLMLQTSAQSGILFIKDFQSQFFGRYNFTPISKTTLLFFEIFADYSRVVVLQVFVIVGIGYLMEIKTIFIDSMGFLKLILSTFMFTYFYASLSSFIAIKTKVSELMATFIHLFNLSIIFTSIALVPNKNLPPWIEQIAKYNPLSHLSNILRESIIISDFDNGNTTFSFLLLGILILISFFCMTRYYKTINYD